MVQGMHFDAGTDPVWIGHKLAAVNLSDLAAMGADPAWSLLSLTLPKIEEHWLQAFSSGLHGLLGQYGVALVGGDTTRGPLCICLQLAGTVPQGESITRSGAKPGDMVCVSGTVGGAALALAMKQERVAPMPGDQGELMTSLYRPAPRVKLGSGLRKIATACIDISDGLAADLGHVARASKVGMEIDLKAIPVPPGYRDYLASGGDWELALGGGDDYELGFTVPESHLERVRELGEQLNLGITTIGRVTNRQGMSFFQEDGSRIEFQPEGYNHFKQPKSG